MPRAIRDPNAPLRPMTFSASRIERWINCNRKAGWQYIAGYEDPGTGATDFGVTVHAVLESYKRDGIPPNTMTDEGALASEALPHVEDFILPPAGNAQIEGYFVLQGRHKWQGYKDLSKPGHVLDYKTSSNIAKWAKTPDVLMTDPQAVLYAAHALTQEPTLAAVRLTWLYLSKRRPYKAHPVDVVMTREHAMRAFAALEAIADEFDAAAALAPPDPPGRHRFVLDTLQPNLSHCDSYGGCPHKARCGISFFSNPENVRHERTNMDFLARLQEMDRVQAAGGDPLARPAADAPLQTMRGVPTPFQTPPMQPPEKGATPALAFAPGGAFAGLGPTTVAPVVQHTATGANTFNPGFLMAPDAPAANDAPVAAAAPTTERMLPIAAPIPAAEFVEPGPGATAVAPGQSTPRSAQVALRGPRTRRHSRRRLRRSRP